MSFTSTTERYEEWLCRRLVIDKAELARKRTLMREDEHAFLRGTFYRWAVLWEKHSGHLDKAPEVLGIGDIHVENFGTWRDVDARLAWGVNDFDEACHLPYTADLVRLATSAILAVSEDLHKPVSTIGEICDAILSGYREGLERPRAYVLAEHHEWLRHLAAAGFEVKDKNDKTRYARFVEQMRSLPPATGIPNEVAEILREAFPKPTPSYTVGHRIAGIGSLGRQRFTAVAPEWYGGIIVREAKALTCSAWLWARGHSGSTTINYNRIVKAAVRAPDPTLQVRGNWVIRRLASDVGKVELQDLPAGVGLELLRAMAKEVAHIHAPSGEHLKAVLLDLDQRPSSWLDEAAEDMRRRTRKDWEELRD